MEPVTTGQIYWGAVPFVMIQCIMVGLVIAFPAMVMHYKGTGPQLDPSKIQIEHSEDRAAAARSEHHAQPVGARPPRLTGRSKRPRRRASGALPFDRLASVQVRVRMRIMKLSKPPSATCSHR